MNIDLLKKTANELVAKGKGILAADESTGTIGKRLASVDVESTEEARRTYRQLLLTAPGTEEFISGIILYDETIRQKTDDGRPFPEALSSRGIMPGIKVDMGTEPLALHPGEKITEGLDGLRERLVEYRELGARFAKWRAVLEINGDIIPCHYAIQANAHALARYAALCQEENLVPIVEPEILMNGPHSLEHCEEVTERTLFLVFSELVAHGVILEGILLKPNMVVPGEKSAEQASLKEVAEATIRCLRRTVPAAVPGIVFLSGGQSAELATAHLNEINCRGSQPWPLSFSYGRALQASTLKAWGGKPENVESAQEILLHRVRCNSQARAGEYTGE